MEVNLKSKLPQVKTTIFATMSALAKQHNAINLSQGFPDFSSSKKLIELVSKHMSKGHNQYAPMQGVPELREQIASKYDRLYGHAYDPEKEITVTAGATQAIYTAITAVVDEGDEVIIFDPAYDCYEPPVILNGGIPIHINLEYPNYSIDWEVVKRRITARTKMIIINTPHNPSGSIMTEDDLKQLQRLTEKTDIIILSDEVYEHLIFDGEEHQSIIRFKDLVERSFAIFSFGKTYHNTGWKMGYCCAPEYLMKEFRKVHQYLVFSVNTPIQHALAEYMKDENAYQELNEFFQEKRDFFINQVKGSRFLVDPCKGTYFQNLCYSGISDDSDLNFAVRLTEEHKIASIPTSVFYRNKLDQKVLRFCFAKEKETLEKAAEILCRI